MCIFVTYDKIAQQPKEVVMKIDGRFWLSKDNESFLGKGRVELLKTIDRIGSIHSAAKEMKMSYKAAWERINSMNALSDKPLIVRTTGGKSGGGTKLTPYAYELIETFETLEAAHKEFIARFSEAGSNPEHLKMILNRTFLTTSARNQLLGKIEKISMDSIESQVSISLAKDINIISSITTTSAKNMLLDIGLSVYAIIKSSDIKISKTKQADINSLAVTISSIESSKNSTQLTLNINKELNLVAMVAHNKDFKVGDKVFAIIEKNSVLIGI